MIVPPRKHLRKIVRRVEILREHEERILAPLRAKQEGPGRFFAEQYDLVMRDLERLLGDLLEGERPTDRGLPNRQVERAALALRIIAAEDTPDPQKVAQSALDEIREMRVGAEQ